MSSKYIFFDLDGTLTNPKIGITKSVQYSLEAFGIKVADTDSLTPFIGPPLKDSYKKYYGFSEAEAVLAVEKYREYFSERGIYENVIYDGIEDLLKEQAALGKTLAVATSKPTVFAEKILRYFNIHEYFAFTAGSELDGNRTAKEQVIRYALELLNIPHTDGVVMVGDREHDVLGAKKVGMRSVGVLYGFGDFAELFAANADYIAADVHELSRLLTKL